MPASRAAWSSMPRPVTLCRRAGQPPHLGDRGQARHGDEYELVARLLDRTIMRSGEPAQRRGVAEPFPHRAVVVVAPGRRGSARHAGPAEAKSLSTGTGVSRSRVPASAARYSAASTATFMVLAA